MLDNTSQKPEQNLFVEWIYEKSVRSVMFAAILAGILIFIIFLIVFFNRMRKKNQALLVANNVRQEFLSRMSHDMRTPMNAIIGFSEFGMNTDSITQAKDYHGKIYKAGKYLLQLINDSLDLNKVDHTNFKLNLEPYSSDEFVKELNNILLSREKEKNLTFTISCDVPVALTVLFDKVRLQQIFVKLLNNAIKFTKTGGKVGLTISYELVKDNMAVITFLVTDTGIGMSEEFLQKKLFLPFEQEGVLPEELGTGLGLSIVKELVSAMKGTITCESKKDEGTTFTVVIPTRVVSKEEQKKKIDVKEDVDLTGKHILLSEDNDMNREIACKILENVGVVVDTATNGKEAVALFNQSKPGYYSGILMDIRMPVMNGIEASKAIREGTHKDSRTIPIIALSANAFDEDKEACTQAGMNEHLSKPIDTKEMLKTLKKYIS